MKKYNGFTLVELLVVSGILVAISGIIGGILASTLRGTETTRNRTAVAQGGNYAITTMSELIKRARSVTGVYDTTPGTFTDCTSSPQGTHLSLEMPDGEVVLTCNYNNTNVIASSSASGDYFLTPNNLVTVPGTCKFVCQQASAYSSPRVEMEFDLGRDDGAGGVVQESIGKFRTQINVRNFDSN
jgi:type II secretory pathway pseudopilin PulG